MSHHHSRLGVPALANDRCVAAVLPPIVHWGRCPRHQRLRRRHHDKTVLVYLQNCDHHRDSSRRRGESQNHLGEQQTE